MLQNAILRLIGEGKETKQVIKFLFEALLNKWAEDELTKNLGLPQGPNESLILANIFLSYIDEHFAHNKNLKYLRYVDDARVMAQEEVEARKAAAELGYKLRELGLEINERKYNLLPPSEMREELWDGKKHIMNLIEDLLQGEKRKKRIQSLVIPRLFALFEESFDPNDKFPDRHLRFSLYRLPRLRNLLGEDEVKEIGSRLIHALEKFPAFTDLFYLFFASFPKEEFKEKLTEFLKSENNFYEWQEAWILQSLLFYQFKPEELEFLRKIAFNKNKHSFERRRSYLLMSWKSIGPSASRGTRRSSRSP